MNKILEALKSKFEGVGVKALEVKAKAMAKKGLTEDDVESVTLESIIDGYADSRSNEAIATARAKWEQSQGGNQNPSNPAEGGNGATGGAPTNQEPEWFKKFVEEKYNPLVEENKTLKASVGNIELAKVTATRSEQLKQVIDKIKNPAFKAPFEGLDVSALSDEQFTTRLESVAGQVDSIVALERQAGTAFAVPASSAGANPNQASDAMMDDLYKNR